MVLFNRKKIISEKGRKLRSKSLLSSPAPVPFLGDPGQAEHPFGAAPAAPRPRSIALIQGHCPDQECPWGSQDQGSLPLFPKKAA